MKKLISCFVSLLFFTLPFVVKTVYADADLLNLSAYSEGATLPYGENIVVGQDEKTGVKWVTVGADEKNDGKMKFPVNLSGDFDLVIKTNISSCCAYAATLFLTADEYQIKLGLPKHNTIYLSVGKETVYDESQARKSGVNVTKLSIKGNVVKLYVNDVFAAKLTLKPDLTYTQLLFNGLDDKDQLLELSLTGNGGSTQPPVTGSGDFDLGKQAGIQQCVTDPTSCGINVTAGTCTGGTHATYNPSAGEVHIPLIDVPGPFGGTQIYEVYLKQQPLTFTFDLDLKRIIPK